MFCKNSSDILLNSKRARDTIRSGKAGQTRERYISKPHLQSNLAEAQWVKIEV